MEIAVCGLTDTSLLFPEGHVCTKNGVYYENYENVTWLWLPSFGYAYSGLKNFGLD